MGLSLLQEALQASRHGLVERRLLRPPTRSVVGAAAGAGGVVRTVHIG
jgi:hypothetical protein